MSTIWIVLIVIVCLVLLMAGVAVVFLVVNLRDTDWDKVDYWSNEELTK